MSIKFLPSMKKITNLLVSVVRCYSRGNSVCFFTTFFAPDLFASPFSQPFAYIPSTSHCVFYYVSLVLFFTQEIDLRIFRRIIGRPGLFNYTTSKRTLLLMTFQLITVYRFTTYRAGLSKHLLVVDNNGTSAFSYAEKGDRNPDKPSMVFVHGLSSNKETWTPIVKVSKN